MKYIAYKGTYNQQIYDSDKKEIRWKDRVIKNVTVKLNKIWKEIKNESKNQSNIFSA